jgi:hypothetical protein
MQVLVPIVTIETGVVLLGAIRLLSKTFPKLPPQVLLDSVPQMMGGLVEVRTLRTICSVGNHFIACCFQAFGNKSPDVRKVSVELKPVAIVSVMRSPDFTDRSGCRFRIGRNLYDPRRGFYTIPPRVEHCTAEACDNLHQQDQSQSARSVSTTVFQ